MKFCMLPQAVGLFVLMFLTPHMINIHGRKFCKDDFMNTFHKGACSGAYELISFKLWMMAAMATLYRLI